MTARIVGFISRADAGLKPPASISRNIQPGGGGAAVHYGGPPSGITSHDSCIRLWRAWQTFHMGTRGWADIAYTGGYCQHGYALAGRGHGVRTAAQGTNNGNQYFHAYCWLGGEGEQPTQEALDALDWWIDQGRTVGGNGPLVRAHRQFHSTSCPGDKLATRAKERDQQPIPTTKTAPHEEDDVSPEDVDAVAQRVRQVLADGRNPYGLDALRRRIDTLDARVAAIVAMVKAPAGATPDQLRQIAELAAERALEKMRDESAS